MNSTGMYPRPRESRRRAALLALGTLLLAACQSGEADVEINVGDETYDPLFPFGYGLSY